MYADICITALLPFKIRGPQQDEWAMGQSQARDDEDGTRKDLHAMKHLMRGCGSERDTGFEKI